MRRLLVALSLMSGLAFSAASVPSSTSLAGPPAPQVQVHGNEVKADDTSFVAPSTVILTDNKPIRRGRLVVFEVAPPADPPKELVKYTYVWDVTPDPGGILSDSNGRKGAFGSGERGDPNKYRIMLVANYSFVDANNKLSMISTKTATYVDIIDSGPPPVDPVNPDVPTPGPGPVDPVNPVKPVLPDGKFKLASFIYDLTATSGMPAAECKALAQAFEGISGRIAAGAATPNEGIKSKPQLIKESLDATRLALGTSYNKWAPVLGQMTTKMDSLAVSALIDYQTAYNELAKGLNAR